MSISSIIKRVVDKSLATEGFVRCKSKTPNLWIYERRQGNLSCELMFQKNYDSITLRVYASQIFNYSFDDFIPINELPPFLLNLYRQNVTGFLEYSNENELELIVTALTDFAVNKIVPLFDVIIRPRKVLSSETIALFNELQRELSTKIQQYADMFIHQYNVSYDTEVNQIKKRIKYVEILLDQNRDNEMKEMTRMFLTAAAYLGELIRQVHGGIWKWNKNNVFCVSITHRYVHPNILYPNNGLVTDDWFPLSYLFNYWDKPEINKHTIGYEYQILLHRLQIENYYEQ